jgi:hypothetical protein
MLEKKLFANYEDGLGLNRSFPAETFFFEQNNNLKSQTDLFVYLTKETYSFNYNAPE